MNKRAFALLTALITFTVGVVLAKLSLRNLFTSTPVVAKDVKVSKYWITGPYQFNGVSIFLIHGPDASNALYIPLGQAIDEGSVRVRKTNNVHELAFDNLSDHDVFVQAGEVVKKGDQNCVLAADFILPAKADSIPIFAVGVEHRRWYPGMDELGDAFTPPEMTSSQSVLNVLANGGKQTAVWNEIDGEQERMTRRLSDHEGGLKISRTILMRELERVEVRESIAPYISKFLPLGQRWDDTIGFAYVFNEQVKSVDIYSSNAMFQRLWPRLLKAAVIEAVLSPGGVKRPSCTLSTGYVDWLLASSALGVETITDRTPRTQSFRREAKEGLFFETRDSRNGAWIHRRYLRRMKI